MVKAVVLEEQVQDDSVEFVVDEQVDAVVVEQDYDYPAV